MCDLSCEKGRNNSSDNRIYGNNEPIPVYQRNKSMKIFENPYSPGPESDCQDQVEVSLANADYGIVTNQYQDENAKQMNIGALNSNENELRINQFNPNEYNQSPHLSQGKSISAPGYAGDWYQTPVLKQKTAEKAYNSQTPVSVASKESKKADYASRFPLQISCARFAIKDGEK